MLITIIIPVYNVADYVDACLASVARQTYNTDVECLIIDDKSTDNSRYIVEKFISQYSGPIDFRLIPQDENKGLSAARNIGIKNAKGDYVLFLDSDDEISKICLEHLAKPLSKRSYDLVVGGYVLKGVDYPVESNKFDREYSIESNASIKEYFINGKPYVMAWNKLYLRSFLLNNKLTFCEGVIYEDELWSLQVANNATSMCLIPSITYFYRVRGNSIMTNINRNLYCKIEKKILIYTLLEDYVLLKNVFDRILFHYIENKRNNLLNDIYQCRKSVSGKELYTNLCSSSVYPDYILSNANLWSIKALLRDLHFFLPKGINYYYWLLYRTIHYMFHRK